MDKRLEEIERNIVGVYEKPAKLVGYEISVSDYEWLVKQAKTLLWTKTAIATCNKQDLTPKELAKSLEKVIT